MPHPPSALAPSQRVRRAKVFAGKKTKANYHIIESWRTKQESGPQQWQLLMALFVVWEVAWADSADVTRWKKLYIPLIIISSAATLKHHHRHVEDSQRPCRSWRRASLYSVCVAVGPERGEPLSATMECCDDWVPVVEELPVYGRKQSAVHLLTALAGTEDNDAKAEPVSQVLARSCGQTEINCSHYYNEITYLLNDKTSQWALKLCI